MADLRTSFLGFDFPTPIVPGAGPNVGSGEAIVAAVEGGAAAVHTKTISPRILAGSGPEPYPFDRDTLLNADLWTGHPLHRWLDEDFPLALLAAGRHRVPILASVGYTAEDVREVAPRVVATGVDILELDVHAAAPGAVVDAARTLRGLVDVPIVAKLSLHQGDPLDLARVLEPYVDAFTCLNSVGPALRIDIETGRAVLPTPDGCGWLSGAAVKPIALRAVFELARTVSRPIIGSGGVTSGRDAAEYLMCGASLVQVCTAALLEGPGAYGRIARELDEWLDRNGYESVGALHRAYVDRWGGGQRVVTEFEEAPVVDPEACIGCTLCERSCFYDAIEAPPRVVARIESEPCFQCGLCVSVCPVGALSFRPRREVTLPAGGRPETSGEGETE